MSERINIDRIQGDPITFNIDLKWSLWTTDTDSWGDRAPQTLAHLRGVFSGEQEESGETIVIHTAPRKEIRFGTVTIDPKTQTVTVEFRAEFDEDPAIYESDAFPIPPSLDELLEQIDAVEQRLLDAIRAGKCPL